MDNRLKLYETAIKCLGQDLVKDEDELACAASVNEAFRRAFGSPIGGGYSTYNMYQVLKSDTRFLKVTIPLPGDIIISPTGYSNGKLRNGHTGIVGENSEIMSNNSFNGLWEKNYIIDTWKRRYKNFGGYPMDYFRVKTPEAPKPIQPDIKPVTLIPVLNPVEAQISLLQAILQAYQKLLAILQYKQTLGVARSTSWPAFRKLHLKETCEACGKESKLLHPLQLHHILPFFKFPEKETDPDNVITLCQPCHFFLAHLKNFKHYNKEIRTDARVYRSRNVW